MYLLPEDLLEQREQEDKTPYDVWKDRGLLRTCEGNTINPKDVTAWFREIQEEYDIFIAYVGYDGWSAKYWVEDMSDYFGKSCMIPVIQGKKTLSTPMYKLGADLEANRIIYNDNPIDKWCMCNTSVEIDKNQNIQPCKTNNQRRRIDGLAALLDAYVILQDRYDEYQSRI
jgi:phage terminase large subunit-like protein